MEVKSFGDTLYDLGERNMKWVQSGYYQFPGQF